jgi:TolB protein
MAFNSDRLGQPHIYVMPAGGGDTELISPFVYGEPGYYTSPDWSPTGSLVAFHGRSRGNFQIMVADADAPAALVRQVTADGVSEDPSWAPDGRHVVFSGRRDSGRGLYVIDSSTGRLRSLVLGGDLLVPDWSPTLVRASALALAGR